MKRKNRTEKAFAQKRRREAAMWRRAAIFSALLFFSMLWLLFDCVLGLTEYAQSARTAETQEGREEGCTREEEGSPQATAVFLPCDFTDQAREHRWTVCS
jgi:hypothetical protein